jgi:predicted nucleic acid-binding Zn ribbon protein
MHCPNCESQTLADQQFCRSCGESLIADEPRRSIPPQFWGLVMAFGGILLAMTGKLADLRWLLFAGVFLSIGGMFLIAALSMVLRSRPRKQKSIRQPDSLSSADTTNKLLPIGEFDFIPSVTENTTDLLKEPVKRSDLNRNS